MRALFSTAYWPNLAYISSALEADALVIEQHEHYGKQTYRNRCEILSANGVLRLSIPVQKRKPKELISEVLISYKEPWQNKHWRAISSAYRNSPYFAYFEDELRDFYTRKYDLLLDYNTAQLKQLFRWLRRDCEISLSQAYESQVGGTEDLRWLVETSRDKPERGGPSEAWLRPYYQTFSEKFEFVPNLSILDLLFNEGIHSRKFLLK
ncbi:MAG TPA: WbqC family protein [Bacteroidia bacterium]|nr:WbqC family protein [Bacteroidia bacterium]